MKFSISTFAWTRSLETHHLDLLPYIRDIGYDGIEISMFSPTDVPVRALRDALQAAGLSCTICAILPAEINPISPDAAVRRAARAHVLSCIEAAADIGAGLLGGPVLAPIGYSTGSRATSDELTWATDLCQSLLDALDSYKVDLSIEPVNRSETHFVRTARDVKQILDAVDHPRLGATLDTFHANIEESNCIAAIRLLGKKLFHVHLSENDRGVLGKGHIPFHEVTKALMSQSYDGLFTVEGFAFDPIEPSAPGYLLADPNVSPQRFAVDSLRFCKTLELRKSFS